MKKDMKKFLAISILSMGFLSSNPSAFCVGDGIFENILIPYIENNQTLKDFVFISKRYGAAVSRLKRNPHKITSRSDLEKSPLRITYYEHDNNKPPLTKIETFEDTHQISADEGPSNQINTFMGNIRTLIYHPQSFNSKRFNYILTINGIEDDLRDATVTKELVDNDGRRKRALIGDRWIRSIYYDFDGMNYCVEYTKMNKESKGTDKANKRIVFLFSPTYLFSEYSKHSLRRVVGENAFSSFDNIMEDFGLKGLFDTNFSVFKNYVFQTGVNAIEPNTFRKCQNVEKIGIPADVKKIERYAFGECTSLKKTEIPDGVTEIGPCAFFECESLKEINIPESVEKIGSGAFNECKTIKKIIIPNKVESIGDFAFSGCDSIKKVEISDDSNIEFIGKNAFNRCKSLKEIKIPKGVKSIRNYTFEKCISLEKIKLPEEMKSIGQNAFNGCKSLKEIKIPKGVKSIGYSAFSGCESLKEIKIPKEVKSIGDGAFSECRSLERVEFPADSKIEFIGQGIFSGCTSLKEIIWNNHTYSVEEFLEAFNK